MELKTYQVIYPSLEIEETVFEKQDGKLLETIREFDNYIKNQEKEILKELKEEFQIEFDDISFFNLKVEIYERIYPKPSFDLEMVGGYNIRTVLIKKGDEKILLDLDCCFYSESEEYIKLLEEKIGKKLKVKFYFCPQEIKIFDEIILEQDIIKFLYEKFVKGRMLDVDIIIS